MIRTRPTARLIVSNDRLQTLLFLANDSQPLHEAYPTMTRYWVTPGGGVEFNETLQQAAKRELWEETGIQTDDIGPCAWYFERVLHLPHESLLLQEHFFLVKLSEAVVHTANMLVYERRTHLKWAWWPLDDLARSAEIFLPPGLPALLLPLLQGNIPSEPIRLSIR